MRLRVVVTGGGTVESIDDVRLSRSLEIETLAGIETSILHTEISNLSKGGFAKSIAKSFCGLRFESVKLEVVLIACHNLYQELSREDLPANLQLVPFTAFADLKEALEKELAKDRTDIVVMAAAVSDYSPMKVQGKISSDSEFFDVRMRRNPKLLESLRDMCGSGSTIAGFKLTSRLPEDRMVEIAMNQSRRCALDFTIANDLSRIDFEHRIHPVTVVSKDYVVRSIQGSQDYVASELAEELLNYSLTKIFAGDGQ